MVLLADFSPSSPRPLLLSQSSYFCPLGMVAPSSKRGCRRAEAVEDLLVEAVLLDAVVYRDRARLKEQASGVVDGDFVFA